MTPRAAISIVFMLNGAAFGSWAARIPAAGDAAGLSSGTLGLALLGIAVGSIAAMPLAGGLAARHGSRRVTVVAGLAYAASVALPALLAGYGLVALTAGLLLMGAASGSLDVAMNAHGVAVERSLGRPVLGSLHAAFSAGGLLGAGVAAAVAAAGLGFRPHLLAVAAATAVLVAVASRFLLPGGVDAAAEPAPLLVRPPRPVLLLGLVAFLCLFCEGASADWSAFYLTRELGAGEAVGAVAFLGFSAGMIAGRLLADRLTIRAGAARLTRVGGLMGAIGLGLGLALGTPAAAILGFLAVGLGVASIVPVAFRAAGSTPGVAPGPGLAAVSTIGYTGFLAGPPTIGGTAEVIGLPAALSLVVLALLGIAAAGGVALTRRPAPA